MEDELIRRAEDLARRCARGAGVTGSGFLTPAQAAELEQWAKRGTDCTVLLRGGYPDAERRAAFFLPDWMDAADFDEAEHLCALECTARFGAPGHRDWLGAVLGLGIGREWLGDILVEGDTARLFCLPSVKQHVLLNLDKVGRWGVRVREIALSAVPQRERQLLERTFSVQSPRLDAVCAGAFGLGRTAAAAAIAQGLVTKNYAECLKCDAPIKDGDVLSLRGGGKCVVLDAGAARSRKGRLFIKIGIFL